MMNTDDGIYFEPDCYCDRCKVINASVAKVDATLSRIRATALQRRITEILTLSPTTWLAFENDLRDSDCDAIVRLMD